MDFVGTEKRVRIIQGKRAIRVRAIEVIQYPGMKMKLPQEVATLKNIQSVHYREVAVVESYMSQHMTKPTKWHVRPAKTQISLGICPVSRVFAVCSMGS